MTSNQGLECQAKFRKITSTEALVWITVRLWGALCGLIYLPVVYRYTRNFRKVLGQFLYPYINLTIVFHFLNFFQVPTFAPFWEHCIFSYSTGSTCLQMVELLYWNVIQYVQWNHRVQSIQGNAQQIQISFLNPVCGYVLIGKIKCCSHLGKEFGVSSKC